ncbi:DUF397 domain-containing protein [Streptomyces lunaelactis]|uniref:DUF397 domain-containing protein n=1 Tax=Streptomyces lunaelactis TaxID=1535768 RepID=UPI0015854AB8|nr:DUF397 domain-containing protein [Streptomyces lunaelactis]NUL03143.1 DUF397 domain-containing protein [Streptomyces lunaelactis]
MSADQTGAGGAELTWFKSSYSGSGGGDCVEVAAAHGTVRVRDSKNREVRSLSFTAAGWEAFVSFATE